MDSHLEQSLLEELGYIEESDVTPVHIPFDLSERAVMEENRNQVESGLTFDDLMEFWKAGVLPAYGTPQFRYMVEDAIATTMAKAEQVDSKLSDRLLMIDDHKAIRAFWELLNRHTPKDGYSDWDKTVFETIRSREHLYEDEWVESPFEVQKGSFRYFSGLNDPAVMTAVAWLEGDDTVEPVNPPRARHRDNGDWILEFKSGRKTKYGKDITFTVIVHAAAFVEFAFEDFENGTWDHVELKRGRKPNGTLMNFTIKYGKNWTEASGYRLRTRGKDVGEIVPIGQLSYEQQRKAEATWLNPIPKVDIDNLEPITESFIRQLAEASEDETVVSLDMEYEDVEASIV